MNIETLVVGPIETNCYIASDPVSREAVIIDAGDDAEEILAYVEQNRLQVKYLLNTHGHFDHIQANDAIREKTGAQLAIHADDVELLASPEKVSAGMMSVIHGCREPELVLHNGDTIAFGPYQLRVIYTPGHSKGGCCFYEVQEKVCFTGDTLFCYSVGRTDFPTGDAKALEDAIREKLFVLLDETLVLPGHDAQTMIGKEKKGNPYF